MITGAAHGVGRLCAISLTEWGAELILCDLDGLALQAVSSGLNCLGRFCDVASEASVTILAQEIDERFEWIDGLINLAGSSYVRPLGTWRVSRALLPMLRRSPHDTLIVNAAARPPSLPDHFPFACSGEGREGLNEALLNATRGSNVRVASVTDDARTMHAPRLSLCASQIVALVAKTFGLPPFTLDSRRNSAA